LHSTYDLIADALWPVKLMCAVASAMLIHEWVCDTFLDRGDDDDDTPRTA
jgi:hypothetical protein